MNQKLHISNSFKFIQPEERGGTLPCRGTGDFFFPSLITNGDRKSLRLIELASKKCRITANQKLKYPSLRIMNDGIWRRSRCMCFLASRLLSSYASLFH